MVKVHLYMYYPFEAFWFDFEVNGHFRTSEMRGANSWFMLHHVILHWDTGWRSLEVVSQLMFTKTWSSGISFSSEKALGDDSAPLLNLITLILNFELDLKGVVGLIQFVMYDLL